MTRSVSPKTIAMFRRAFEMSQSEDIAAVVHELHEAIGHLVEFVSRSPTHKQQALLSADELLEAQSKFSNALFYVGIRPER